MTPRTAETTSGLTTSGHPVLGRMLKFTNGDASWAVQVGCRVAEELLLWIYVHGIAMG